jgi:hypothetical protein
MHASCMQAGLCMCIWCYIYIYIYIYICIHTCPYVHTQRAGESGRYAAFSRLPNKMLLFKGTRMTSVASVLSQGLRTPPAEAPTAAYILGMKLCICIYTYIMSTQAFTYLYTYPAEVPTAAYILGI